MRELISKFIVLLTSILIVILSIVFALSQNQDEIKKDVSTLVPITKVVIDLQKAEKGRELFFKHGCQACHSVKGKGNPRNPLEGVGENYDRDILEKLIVGDSSKEEKIPKRIFKQKYKQLPSNELESLVEYMQSL